MFAPASLLDIAGIDRVDVDFNPTDACVLVLGPRVQEAERKDEARHRSMEGWEGWDEYASFYDWENARTMGRRDVRFWSQLAGRSPGLVLELGCGTGRVTLPVARAGARLVGVDRSARMLERNRRRLRRARLRDRVALVRGDIRALAFLPGSGFTLVMAPYGILQSLLTDQDVSATLESVGRVLAPGGVLGVDLVPDVPRWKECARHVTLRGRRGRRGGRLTLIESVRQDRARGLTVFDQEWVEQGRDAHSMHCFSISFRTLTVPDVVDRIEEAGFRVDAVLGDYQGRPWDERAEVWMVMATRR